MAKPMTAAEYAAHAEQKKKNQPTEIVTLKSGSIFELRRPDLRGYVVMGRYPKSLVTLGQKALSDDTAEMSIDEQEDARIFMIQIVRECMVTPRLDQIEESILVEDVYEIYSWAMNHMGVAGVNGLRSFRGRQTRRTAGNKPTRKKLQPETVSSAANL